jgi:hypothetical protein
MVKWRCGIPLPAPWKFNASLLETGITKPSRRFVFG